MASSHATDPEHVDAHHVANCDCLARLRLKPSGSARGAVDGVWWPRSRDPAVELVALTEELGAQRTAVRGIALTRAGWDSAPRRIRLASGRKVAVDWFRGGDVRMVRIIDTNYQRRDLLIIPADTTPALAELALTRATDGQDPHISASGSDHSASGCLPVNAPVSPANEEGSPNHRVRHQVSGIQPSDVVGCQRIVLRSRRS
ncbi:MAG TPA: DUF5994 family protein [Pseudonocardiaceae bacterium]|nr:DUF5994 family protein [Pseudonocardiaceae bacterium]